MGVMKVCVYSTGRRLYGGDEGMCLQYWETAVWG